MTTREIHQSRAINLRRDYWVIGVLAFIDFEDHGFHAESIGLGPAQVVPPFNDGWAVGYRRGRQLDVARRATGDEPAFDLGHLGKVLTRSDQGQRPGPDYRSLDPH